MDERLLKTEILKILRKRGIRGTLSKDIAGEIISVVRGSNKNETQDEAIAYIDGGSRGNPGEGASACIIFLGDRKIFEGGRFYKRITNNEAEYNALLAALSEAIRLNLKRLKVFTDSELLARQINKIYSIRSPILTPLYIKANQLIQKLDKFSIINIPREENLEADRLANSIMNNRRHLNISDK